MTPVMDSPAQRDDCSTSADLRITERALIRASAADTGTGVDLPGDAASYLRIESPGTRLEQLVLSPASIQGLRDFLERADTIRDARRRLRLHDSIDYGRSTLILLHGPTGTGKTMTARAMANHADRPLVTFLAGHGRRSHIDFEERLATFLDVLERTGGIGLIDECHAYFGEDDYELPVFLTEIERCEVTVFLATTLPELLGTAMDRRISYKVATTQPDAAQRRRIWRNLIPPAAQMPA